MTEPVCVEDGCTQPATVEQVAAPDVVELVCTDHTEGGQQ